MLNTTASDAKQAGRNVRTKAGLSKANLDQGWFELRRQLDYKLACRGGPLIAAPPLYTSHTCPACGHVSKLNRQMQVLFKYVDCDYVEHVDLVVVLTSSPPSR